ncbi:hypothetical protein GCK72_025940 [Caenorhabditis remanei]|uniref:Uncharacterized protein n=1 Tax=Caenorhabditis remanei TaxID=31234 RepID=A0A6A5G457_CAERE|nr:hypothetical protein GCK72_025940 [Caenorhabditis remanei]KAF1749472.1 hypothetical protein GCK72_025940 [Caenorhabditis remanei]
MDSPWSKIPITKFIGRLKVASPKTSLVRSKLTPSLVGFKENGEVVIGEPAKSQQAIKPENTVYDLKTIIGGLYDDRRIQQRMKSWPFKIVNNSNQPVIEIELGSGTKKYTPEEITSLLVANLKSFDSNNKVIPLKNAVVTIPVYFDNNQRVAIKDAVKLAGFKYVRLIKEPIAAATAYKMDEKGDDRKILVFHLGGATFDVTLLNFESGVFEVLANQWNRDSAGRVFDERIVEHFSKLYKAKTGKDLDHDKIPKLYQEAEKAKITLSDNFETVIQLKDPEDFNFLLTRATFEELNIDIFQDTLKSVEQVLEDSFCNKTDVHDIILIGGSSKIPKIRKLIKIFFNGKESAERVEPDLAVVTGAAMIAGKLGAVEKTTFESTVDWIVSKLFWTGNLKHDELK